MPRAPIPRRARANATPAAVLVAAAVLAFAAPAAAQKDVGDPLEHFLGTRAADGAKRTLASPVLRIVEDFNNDGLADVGLWQARDLDPGAGPLFLYMQRKDGRFAASGSVAVAADTLVRVVPGAEGGGRLLVCTPRGAGEPLPGAYAVSGFIVTEVPRADLPAACPPAGRDAGACREYCGGPPPAAERLDAERYRQGGVQAWIRR